MFPWRDLPISLVLVSSRMSAQSIQIKRHGRGIYMHAADKIRRLKTPYTLKEKQNAIGILSINELYTQQLTE